MAAYGALVSLMNLIEQVNAYNAHQQFFLGEEQKLLQSLIMKVSFLQEFMESYDSHEGNKEVQELEIRIMDAAYAAEVIVELHVVDEIQARHDETSRSISPSTSLLQKVMQNIDSIKKEIFMIKEKKNKEENIVRSTNPAKRSSYILCQGLQRVIRDMDYINEEVVKIKEKSSGLEVHQPIDLELVHSRKRPPTGKDAVVGLDDSLIEIMDKLTREQPNLQTIPITGTGGIGKTTLANYVYDNPYIVECFDVRGWVTISQDYNVRQMLSDLLRSVGVLITNQSEEESFEYQLGEKLYKHLSGRRYLIVMDDMWDIEAWDKIKLFFPNNQNKSRVVVTTRLSYVANSFGSTDLHRMSFMDENKSWSLFCSKVFVHGSCPDELERIGKKIVKNCHGLPLSILVIAGLLAKSNMVREYWEYVAENVSTIANSEEDERCLRILSLSYHHLPIHLKPCFLYMGVFAEDREIRVSTLIKLWIADGFLNPSGEKCLEDVAEDYLKDLVDRNIFFVTKFGAIGNMKFCKIHDLWRDLALREAKKQRFICVTAPNFSHSINDQCRIARRDDMPYRKTPREVSRGSFSYIGPSIYKFILGRAPSLDFRLLRALTHYNQRDREVVLRLVNSRYIHLEGHRTLSSSICLVWNLQTLIIDGDKIAVIAPSEIWEMQQLRHVKIEGITLPDPLRHITSRKEDEFVMENFQTLSFVLDFKCTEEVVRRIPNIKKLRMWYLDKGNIGLSRYCLNNLCSLHKLQSLVCGHPNDMDPPPRTDLLQHLSFPLSIKKLSLCHCFFNNEDMTTKVGSLPNLEKLKLVKCRIRDEWSPVEGQFLSLKFLEMEFTYLKGWTAESSHFPCLEHIALELMNDLEEIPSGIGDIETLRTIRLTYCTGSIVASAKNILEEQHSLGNEDLSLVLKYCY